MLDLIPTVSAVVIVLGFFIVIFFILWIALPFSVFGIKPLLRQMIDRLDGLDRRLENLERTAADSREKEDRVQMETGPREVISGRK